MAQLDEIVITDRVICVISNMAAGPGSVRTTYIHGKNDFVSKCIANVILTGIIVYGEVLLVL